MDMLKDLLNREPPEILYHYTSFSGFKGIVEEGAIWATDIRFLNDTKEFNYGIDLVKRFVVESALGIGQFLASSIIDQALQSDLLAGKTFQTCVASFSEKSDLLSQWRGYCPEGRGVCVGFRSDLFHNYVNFGVRSL
jgi:hypothetical protein